MFTIVSNWHGAMYEPMALLVLPNRRDYAVQHGYEAREFNCPGHYGKITALLNSWGSGFEWLWWLDVDAIITRPELRIEEVLDGHLVDGVDVLIGCDHNGINAGSMFLRCSDEVRRCLVSCLDRRQKFDFPPFHDQLAIGCMLWNLYDKVRVIPRQLHNAYPGEWTGKDFVLHTPMVSQQERLNLLRWRLEGLANRDSQNS